MLFSGQNALILVLLLLTSYFLGNINFAKILSKLRNDDITKHGSGNPGTVNMLRTHGILFGALTLLLDGAKGALPALAAWHLFGANDGGLTAVYATHLVGFMAVVGHIFPVINKFKGGKGVATAFGYFTVINPLASAILFVVGMVIFIFTKIASLGTLGYIAGFIIWQLVLNFNSTYIYPMAILLVTAILIFVVHRSNMKKFLNKQESKFKFSEIFQKDKQLILSIAKKFSKKQSKVALNQEASNQNKTTKNNEVVNNQDEVVAETQPKQEVLQDELVESKNKNTNTKSGGGKK